MKSSLIWTCKLGIFFNNRYFPWWNVPKYLREKVGYSIVLFHWSYRAKAFSCWNTQLERKNSCLWVCMYLDVICIIKFHFKNLITSCDRYKKYWKHAKSSTGKLGNRIIMLCIFEPDIFLTIFIVVDGYLFCIEWPRFIS